MTAEVAIIRFKIIDTRAHTETVALANICYSQEADQMWTILLMVILHYTNMEYSML